MHGATNHGATIRPRHPRPDSPVDLPEQLVDEEDEGEAHLELSLGPERDDEAERGRQSRAARPRSEQRARLGLPPESARAQQQGAPI